VYPGQRWLHQRKACKAQHGNDSSWARVDTTAADNPYAGGTAANAADSPEAPLVGSSRPALAPACRVITAIHAPARIADAGANGTRGTGFTFSVASSASHSELVSAPICIGQSQNMERTMCSGQHLLRRRMGDNGQLGKYVSWAKIGFAAFLLVFIPTAFSQEKPSCSIISIDRSNALVSAKVNATGEGFQFTLNNPALLGTLKIGQGVYANFQTKQISLDGQHVSGVIVSIGAPKGPLAPVPPGKAPSTLPAPQTSPKASGGSAPLSGPLSSSAGTSAACCVITTIDVRAQLAAAKVNSSGETFEFSVPNSVPIQDLRAGQPAWANFKTMQVSLNGHTACCPIVSSAGSSSTTVGQPKTQSALVGPDNSAAGLKQRGATTNFPAPPQIQNFAVLPGPIPGGQEDVGRVDLRGVPGSGATVRLSSDRPSVASVPSQVQVPGSGPSTGSTVIVVNTWSVMQPTDVTLSAQVVGTSQVSTTKLTVRPAQLSVIGCTQDLIQSGSPAKCRVWLDGKAAAPTVRIKNTVGGNVAQRIGQGVQVNITTNPPIATAPATVNITPGNEMTEFEIPTPANLPSERIVVTASYEGVTKSAGISVTGESAHTAFDPMVHGFHFRNTNFPGSILLDIPLIGTVDLGSTSYALCGGMTFAALDTFISGGRAPNDTTPPASGTELRSYLFGRQRDSLEDDNAWLVRRFIEWMAYPDTTSYGVTGLDVRSFGEFLDNIRPLLAAGHPVPLGVVKASISFGSVVSGDVFVENHQVLAIGYEVHLDPTHGNHWDILIYDPNFPDQIQRMHTHSNVAGYQTDYQNQSQSGSFRGFFASRYTPKQPYWALNNQANSTRSPGALTPPKTSSKASGSTNLPAMPTPSPSPRTFRGEL